MSIFRIQNTKDRVGEAGAVGIVIKPEDTPDAEAILLGFAPGKAYPATGMARHGNYLQWGWSAPPSKMTRIGQDLFINCLCYIHQFDGKVPQHRR